jgi:hypothetical protein
MSEPNQDPYHGLRHHELLDLFNELSFAEKVRKTLHGLKQPRDSGEYKWAKLQMIRLSAPLAAVGVPLVTVVALMCIVIQPPSNRSVQVQIVEPEEMPKLDEIQELDEKPLEPPEPMDVEFSADAVPTDTLAPPSPATDFSPMPAQFDAVAMVKSPVIMKGIYGSRSPGMRGTAMAKFGAPAGVEGAVLRALRWLKKEQQSDGSWKNHAHAMTGMALLAYLAHGETPASEEFGATVEKAIRWLMDHQEPGGGFPRSYQHAIATYALCEAYALTKVPAIQESATKALTVLIKGQNPSGGFDYGLNNTQRDDTSVMGWCAQALKAGKMAGLTPEGLDNAMKLAVQGFQKNASPGGGFGYSGPGKGGLTGVGVLCMQLLGAANKAECKLGLVALEPTTFNWEGGGTFNANYYWYYITQAKFHAGDETWKKWNATFAPALVKHQTIIPKAVQAPSGEMVDIGWWDMPKEISGATDGPVMNTALSCLQLEVYYRYLPTYMKPEQVDEAPAEAAGKGDVDIQISI